MKHIKKIILIITVVLGCTILLGVLIKLLLLPIYMEYIQDNRQKVNFKLQNREKFRKKTVVESFKVIRTGELLGSLLANACGCRNKEKRNQGLLKTDEDFQKLINEPMTDKDILKYAPKNIKTFDLPKYLLEDLSYSKNGFKDKDGNVWIVVYHDKEKNLYVGGNFDSKGEQQVKKIKNDAILEKSLADWKNTQELKPTK